MEQFVIFCFCFYISLFTVSFIYHCINCYRLNHLNCKEAERMLKEVEDLIIENKNMIKDLKAEDEDFNIKVKTINDIETIIDRYLTKIDKLNNEDSESLKKIKDLGRTEDLFLTILTFGIYRKEEL